MDTLYNGRKPLKNTEEISPTDESSVTMRTICRIAGPQIDKYSTTLFLVKQNEFEQKKSYLQHSQICGKTA